jgi:hypothetical protein
MPASMSSRSPNGRLTCRYWITPSGGKSTSACAGKRSLGPRASVRRGINMEPAFVGLRCVCLSPSLIPASATCGGAASGCTPRRAIISKRVAGVNESHRSSLHMFGRLLASDASRRCEVTWAYGGCPLRCYHRRRSARITSFAVLSLPLRWAAQRHFCQSTVPPRVLAEPVAAPFSFFRSPVGVRTRAQTTNRLRCFTSPHKTIASERRVVEGYVSNRACV